MKIDSLSLSPVNLQKSFLQEDDMNVSGQQEQTFGKMLSNALNDVNKLQLNAQQTSVDLAAGKIQDISEAVIATEKATIALQLTMQVRNKVVDAYQEIMRMQV
ncbi:MAG: Flagellar hook-basal body complex protein fliE [Firmicutes bacterium]|nr:Flagellar hook-basal body complex protein fliE [Bacillota bacterium]